MGRFSTPNHSRKLIMPLLHQAFFIESPDMIKYGQKLSLCQVGQGNVEQRAVLP